MSDLIRTGAPGSSREVSSATTSSVTAAPSRTAAPWVPVSPPAPVGDNVTTRVTERLTEKAKARARRRRVDWAKRGAAALVVVAAAWTLALSPLFALDVDRVDVAGRSSVVDPGDVTAVIAPHDGRSLVLVSTSDIAAQLESLVGVREASVERVWPRGLVITLTAREPVAAIPLTDAEGFQLVDVEGVGVAVVESVPGEMPVISIPVGPDNVRVLGAVLTVLDEVPAELRARVQAISAQTEDSVTFDLRDGPHVEWGSAADSALKAEVLTVLLESDDAANAAVIDVSAPTLPITRAERE